MHDTNSNNLNKNENTENNGYEENSNTIDARNEKTIDHEAIAAWRRLEDLTTRMRASYFQNYGPGGDPARGQGRVLSLLKMQPEISQKELCYLLGMRQQSLSELLLKLEQKGYVSRKPSEEDRRSTIVSLTEEGRQAAEQQPKRKGGMHRILAALDEEERKAFTASLDKLIAAAEKELTEMGVDPYGPASHRPGMGPHPGRHGGPHHEGWGRRHHGPWDEETLAHIERGRCHGYPYGHAGREL